MEATLNLSFPAQANKCDLSHMRAVKSEVHNRFADENVLYSFMMSAKSGDQVRPGVLRAGGRSSAARRALRGRAPRRPPRPRRERRARRRRRCRAQVKSCFLRVAAVLSNTSFSRPEIEVESQTVVKATIVEHAQHDPNVHSGSVPAYTKSKSSCAVS